MCIKVTHRLLSFLVWMLFKSQTASAFLRATMIAPIMDTMIIAAIYPARPVPRIPGQQVLPCEAPTQP